MSSTYGPPRAGPGRRGRLSGWRDVNIGPAERAGRVLLGAAAVVAGGWLLTGAGSALAVAIEVLLVAAGLDLLVTGVVGHCPLYAKLGHVPRSLRGRS